MSVSIDESYAYCRKVARSRARNFYYSFLLLDQQRRSAMCALYTFNRVCDDLSDDPGESGSRPRADRLEVWRSEMGSALTGQYGEHPCWPAFHDTVRRYGIPEHYFHEMIDGVESDLTPRSLETFDDLYRYCYQVASVVGLSVLYVFGYKSEEAPPLAEKCGVAFQLTNILRDVREDALAGRVYLPGEDLARFGVGAELLRDGEATAEFVELMRFEAGRAHRYYQESKPLVGLVAPRSQGALWALIEIYFRLLERIESSDYDVLRRRIRVPTWEKCAILARGLAKRDYRTSAV